MKENKKSFGEVFENGINKVALNLVKRSANSACVWSIHQPEFPEEAKRFTAARK